MRSVDALATLQELGSSQRGLVTTSQAEQYGISRVALGRLRERELIYQARRGVYALPTAGDESLQDLHAAWLSTDPTEIAEQRLGQPDVAVSHVSAARVHGLGDLVAPHHEFTSTIRRRTSQPDVRIHRGDLPDDDVAIISGLPVTSIPRTVGDIADGGVDLDHLAYVVRDALSSPQVRPRDLARRLDRAAARHGFEDGDALVEACLERAGLPPVAENLASARESLMRTLGGDAVRELMEKTFGDMFADQWKTLTADRASTLWGLADPPALDAIRSLPAQHTATRWRATTSNVLESFRMPAPDALRSSTLRDLNKSMRLGSPWATNPSGGQGMDVQASERKKVSDGDEAIQAADASWTEDVPEGEAEREGS